MNEDFITEGELNYQYAPSSLMLIAKNVGSLITNTNLVTDAKPVNLDSLFNSVLNKTKSDLANNIGAFNVSSFEANRYLEYKLNLNIEEIYAQKQGWVKSWANSTAKMGVNFVGSFAQEISSILSLIAAGTSGTLDYIYSTSLTRAIEDISNNIRESLLTYQTSYDRENLFLSLLNLFDKGASSILQGAWESLGFAGGMIAGTLVTDAVIGAATEGLGVALLIAAQAKKFTQMLSKIDDIKDIKRGVELLEKAIKLGILSGAGEKAYGVARQLFASTAEARIEALETEAHLQKDLEKDFFNKNGYSASGQELEKITEFAKDAARERFIANTALLTITNQIQFLNLFKEFNFSRSLFNKYDDAVIKGVGDSIEDKLALELRGKSSSYLGKVGEFAKNTMGLFSVSEGVEEGLQFAIDKITENYAKTRMNDEHTASLLSSTMHGLKELATTEEGWINTVSGIIGGAVSGAAFKGVDLASNLVSGKLLIGEDTNELVKDAQIQNVNKAFNYKSMFGSFNEKVGDANAVTQIESNASDGIKNNKRFQFEKAKDASIANYALTALRNNQWEGAMMQVEELAKLKESIKQDETGINLNELASNISSVKEKMNEIKTIYDRVNSKLSGKHRSSLYYQNLKEELVFQHFLNKRGLEKGELLANEVDGRYKQRLSALSDLALIVSVDDNMGNSYFFLSIKSSTFDLYLKQIAKEFKDAEELKDLSDEHRLDYEKKKKDYDDLNNRLNEFEADKKGIEDGEVKDKALASEVKQFIQEELGKIAKEFNLSQEHLHEEFDKILDSKKHIYSANRALDTYNELIKADGQERFLSDLENFNVQRILRLKKKIEKEEKKKKPVTNPLTEEETENEEDDERTDGDKYDTEEDDERTDGDKYDTEEDDERTDGDKYDTEENEYELDVVKLKEKEEKKELENKSSELKKEKTKDDYKSIIENSIILEDKNDASQFKDFYGYGIITGNTREELLASAIDNQLYNTAEIESLLNGEFLIDRTKVKEPEVQIVAEQKAEEIKVLELEDFKPKLSEAVKVESEVDLESEEDINDKVDKTLKAMEEEVDSNDVTNEDYNSFIDNGNVLLNILNSIADKVKNRKPLSDREISIFSAKTKEINDLISSEQQIDNTTEDILSTETISQARFDEMFEQESTMTQEEIENRDKKIIEDFKNSIGCQKI